MYMGHAFLRQSCSLSNAGEIVAWQTVRGLGVVLHVALPYAQGDDGALAPSVSGASSVPQRPAPPPRRCFHADNMASMSCTSQRNQSPCMRLSSCACPLAFSVTLCRCSRRGTPPPSPNRCFGADSMASTILHELAEMATNPFGNGWDSPNFRPGSHENGDVCDNAEFPAVRWSKHRKFAFNVRGTGGLRFLVQSIYDPQSASCTMAP